MPRCLLVVDVQNDFCESGKLAVEGGASVAKAITEYLATHKQDYALVIASQDWHINPVEHFSTEPNFVDTWPEHCIAYSDGAQLHPNINQQYIDATVRKGLDEAAYSAFEGLSLTGITLNELLKQHQIDALDIVGIATDYCVMETAMDARSYNYETVLLLHYCAAVNATSGAAAVKKMYQAGVKVNNDAY